MPAPTAAGATADGQADPFGLDGDAGRKNHADANSLRKISALPAADRWQCGGRVKSFDGVCSPADRYQSRSHRLGRGGIGSLLECTRRFATPPFRAASARGHLEEVVPASNAVEAIWRSAAADPDNVALQLFAPGAMAAAERLIVVRMVIGELMFTVRRVFV